jgi:integrase
VTAVFTGLRAGELRGLRWSEVDLRKAEVHVHQRADRYNEIAATKSEAGERTVPLPQIVVNILREWKLVCPKADTGRADRSCESIKELRYVFPNRRPCRESRQHHQSGVRARPDRRRRRRPHDGGGGRPLYRKLPQLGME